MEGEFGAEWQESCQTAEQVSRVPEEERERDKRRSMQVSRRSNLGMHTNDLCRVDWEEHGSAEGEEDSG